MTALMLTMPCQPTTTHQPAPLTHPSNSGDFVPNDDDAQEPLASMPKQLTPTMACTWMAQWQLDCSCSLQYSMNSHHDTPIKLLLWTWLLLSPNPNTISATVHNPSCNHAKCDAITVALPCPLNLTVVPLPSCNNNHQSSAIWRSCLKNSMSACTFYLCSPPDPCLPPALCTLLSWLKQHP